MGEYIWISADTAMAELNDASKDPAIECLNFVDVHFSDAVTRRMKVALRNRSFERISVMSCRGRLDEALSVILDYTDVKCLKLDCLTIKPSTAAVIGEGVARNSSLKCLSLQAMCMTKPLAEALHHALERTTTLESMYWNAITAKQSDRDWVDTILQAFQCNRSLRHLGIARVRGMEAEKIFRSVREHTSLRSLSLACLDGISHSTLAALSDLSNAPNNSISRIKISVRGDWTNLRNLPRKPIKPIKYHLSITTSNSYCDMDALGKILVQHDSIEFLSLAHCGLDEESIANLASYLSCVKGVKHLSLHGNFLNSGSGCEALLASLRDNYTLERLDLPVLVEQKAAIDHFLDLNRAGRRKLGDFDLPLSLWPLILERAASMDYTRAYPIFTNPQEVATRQANAIFHLLQGPVPVAFC